MLDFQYWSNVSVRNKQSDKHGISVIITMIMYNIPSTGNDLHLSDSGSDSDT